MLARKNELRREKDAIIREYLSALNYVVEVGRQKISNDPEFDRVREEFMVARRNNPDDLVRLSGPLLWEYREQIKTGEIEFFVNKDFTSDVEKFGDKAGKKITQSEMDRSVVLISNIKKSWNGCSPAEQKSLVSKTQSLLTSYVKYLKTCKELSQLEN
jgi:hypothetical protein